MRVHLSKPDVWRGLAFVLRAVHVGCRQPECTRALLLGRRLRSQRTHRQDDSVRRKTGEHLVLRELMRMILRGLCRQGHVRNPEHRFRGPRTEVARIAAPACRHAQAEAFEGEPPAVVGRDPGRAALAASTEQQGETQAGKSFHDPVTAGDSPEVPVSITLRRREPCTTARDAEVWWAMRFASARGAPPHNG